MNIKGNVSSVNSCHYSPFGGSALVTRNVWALGARDQEWASLSFPAGTSVLLQGSSGKNHSRLHLTMSPKSAHNLIFFPESWKGKCMQEMPDWSEAQTLSSSPGNSETSSRNRLGWGDRIRASVGGERGPPATPALSSICYPNADSAHEEKQWAPVRRAGATDPRRCLWEWRTSFTMLGFLVSVTQLPPHPQPLASQYWQLLLTQSGCVPTAL